MGTCVVIGLSFCSLPTPTIWFSLDRKRRSRKRGQKKMETFWFFRLRIRRNYDSAYDSNFWFSVTHKTPLPTPTPSLVKTSLKRWDLILLAQFHRDLLRRVLGDGGRFSHAFAGVVSKKTVHPVCNVMHFTQFGIRFCSILAILYNLRAEGNVLKAQSSRGFTISAAAH